MAQCGASPGASAWSQLPCVADEPVMCSQHVFNRLNDDSVAELLVLRDLLSTMGGIQYDVSTVSMEDIDSRSGGERLRSS